MRVSLLDRSRSRAGASDAETIAGTVERAVRAEALGFRRFWTAEHHGVPGIASSAPAVLLAAIGARTRHIRLGSGGIMLPNHRPLVVAEQALLLESLYPGRIDLGLGGSLGFTPAVREALGRRLLRDGEYAAELSEVRNYLTGRAAITARPQTAPPPMFLLAIKDGLSLAARLGLPAVVGGPLLRDAAAIEAYFRAYQPTPEAPEPYLIASAEVLVAESAERARELLLPEAWAHADSREVGEFRPLRPVQEVQRLLETASPRKAAAVRNWPASAVVGTPAQAAERLAALLERTGASELMASVSAFDPADVAATDTFLASLQD